MKPVGGKPLHCDPVPPCPCPEYEKLERGGCLCSGNAWGEEIDDEVGQTRYVTLMIRNKLTTKVFKCMNSFNCNL